MKKTSDPCDTVIRMSGQAIDIYKFRQTSKGWVIVGLWLSKEITKGLHSSSACSLDPTSSLRLETQITHLISNLVNKK